MPNTMKNERQFARAADWPDLSHKYRRLAIPAVVAATLPDKATPQPHRRLEEKRARETPGGRG